MKELSLSILKFGVFDSRVQFPRIQKTEPRTVNCYELELYLEDQHGVGHINGEPIRLQSGTMICAKPGQIRYSLLPIRCLYLHLRTQTPELIHLLEDLPDAQLLPEGEREEFEELLRLDVENEPDQWLLAQSVAVRLLYRLKKSAAFGRGKLSTAHRLAMEKAELYIRDNLTAPLSLEELAQAVSFSPSYFHKVFRSCYGMTPAEYILNCRISTAKIMLVSGQHSLARIAEACGFGSQSYFNFRFRQVTGQTPLQYRRDHLSRIAL